MLKKEEKIFRKCEHPGCEAEGEFRAPKDRQLKDYYWFCLKHVSEYNKMWNYYDGMTQEEIERENKLDETWHSPSWKFGISLDKLASQGKLEDPFEIYDKFLRKRPGNHTNNSNFVNVPKLSLEELEALKFFEIEFPYTKIQLKSKYKILVKKYHPDLNAGSKNAEEMFKKVVENYSILLKKIEKNRI